MPNEVSDTVLERVIGAVISHTEVDLISHELRMDKRAVKAEILDALDATRRAVTNPSPPIATDDPVERIVGDALNLAGFEWRNEGHPDRRDDPITLDFAVVDGPHIEVKRFHTPRSQTQLAQAENVILIQGIEAARWFARALVR